MNIVHLINSKVKLLIVWFICLVTVSCTAQEVVDSRKREIIFRNVSVITMDKEELLENRDVLIKNGRIVSISKATNTPFNNNTLVVNGKGKFLMPGLAEMHAHIPPIEDIEPMKEALLLFSVNGVTTIRGMLGHSKHLELRSKIRSGEIMGPHFYTSGPSFNGNSVKTPQDAAEMVRNQKQAGYDFLKLHPGLTKENFAAMVSAAKAVDIPFAGHVSFDVGVWRAIDAGYASIDHLDGFVESLVPGIENMKEQDIGLFGMYVGHLADTAKLPALMEGLRKKNIWVVPTQALAERWFNPALNAETLVKEPEMKYMSSELLKGWVKSKNNLSSNPKYNAQKITEFIELRRKLIYACNKYGVGLLLGSDAPQVFDVPGFSVHQELQYLVDAGLTPYEALRTGTVNVAKFYKSDEGGVIKVGAVSDLILLNGNPLLDIKQSANIEGVMLGNQWLNKRFIDSTLKKLEKTN
jgi:imidazolonepropionase-like amidohydrolase